MHWVIVIGDCKLCKLWSCNSRVASYIWYANLQSAYIVFKNSNNNKELWVENYRVGVSNIWRWIHWSTCYHSKLDDSWFDWSRTGFYPSVFYRGSVGYLPNHSRQHIEQYTGYTAVFGVRETDKYCGRDSVHISSLRTRWRHDRIYSCAFSSS